MDYEVIDSPNSTIRMHSNDDVSYLMQFSEKYGSVHGYIAVIICIVGIIFNILSIVVLIQKNMISSTNIILIALAITDLLTMASYLPNAVYFYCIASPEHTYPHSKGWIIYLLINTYIMITIHTMSMWLTVVLAVFRYIVVCHHSLGPKLASIWRAKITIFILVISIIIFCIPNYVMYRPIELPGNHTLGEDISWWFEENNFVTPFHKMFNFWLFGVVLKVAPCVLLVILSSLLIHAMTKAEKRRKRLLSMGKRAESERTSEHNRTTALLVAVVIVFVIVELPNGIMALLSGVSDNIFKKIYVPLGDIWDILVLINCAVNFILYIMSRQFRETFMKVFFNRPMRINMRINNGTQYINIVTTQV